MLKLDLTGISTFVKDYADVGDAAAKMTAHPMSGWTRLPREWTAADAKRLTDVAARLRGNADMLVVAGAGGSSLGARALIDAFGDTRKARVLFTGDNLSGNSAKRILDALDGDFAVVVSSKSGTTLETLLAMRLLLTELKRRYGNDAYKRLVVVTEPKKSALRVFAEEHGCETFEIPVAVGGRYSVLTACGLFPAAFAGVDVDAVMRGALRQADAGLDTAAEFAAARLALYGAGFRSEIFACFEPMFERLGSWWRQLYGESEGKQGGGAFPSTVALTGDLHSMGQYIQEGPRSLYETMLTFGSADASVTVPPGDFADGIDALNGRSLSEINALASTAVKAAHIAGGVPVVEVRADKTDAESVGELIYFFETACALSCFPRGVDPFDQPGVEAYKVRVKKALGL